MKLSFVIPAYNEEKYIEDCLSSIFELDALKNYEVILADNNSTDKTVEIVSFKYPQVKIVSVSKKGPAAARNSGAQVAKGELIAFIDADCRLPKEWWIRVKKIFQSSQNLVLLNGPYRYYEITNLLEQFLFFLSNVVLFSLIEFLARTILRLGGPVYGGNVIVREEAFKRINGFDEKFDFYGEDINLAKRLMKEGEVRFNSSLWVYSSVRRLESEGRLKSWYIYSINTAWALFFGKVLHKKYRDIR